MRAAMIVLLLLAPCAARAARVLVVLSEPPSSSHQEALDGLRAEWSEPIETASADRPEPIETASADRPLPPGPHGVIIALGARAALRARRADAPVVVALAPAYRDANPAPTQVLVAMTPSPELFVKRLAAAGVRRLLAVRSASASAGFIRRAIEAGKQSGVSIEDGVLTSPDDLPRLLRASGANADAVWLAPDPAVVTPEAFNVVREFSRARKIPFFAPAAGLVSDEIRGELTVTFHDCGQEAARAAKELLAGRLVSKVVYPSPSPRETSVLPSTASAK